MFAVLEVRKHNRKKVEKYGLASASLSRTFKRYLVDCSECRFRFYTLVKNTLNICDACLFRLSK